VHASLLSLSSKERKCDIYNTWGQRVRLDMLCRSLISNGYRLRALSVNHWLSELAYLMPDLQAAKVLVGNFGRFLLNRTIEEPMFTANNTLAACPSALRTIAFSTKSVLATSIRYFWRADVLSPPAGVLRATGASSDVALLPGTTPPGTSFVLTKSLIARQSGVAIPRSQCLETYQGRDAMLTTLCAAMSGVLDVAVSPDDRIGDLGLTSVSTLQCAQLASVKLGVVISPVQLLNHTTSREVVASIGAVQKAHFALSTFDDRAEVIQQPMFPTFYAGLVSFYGAIRQCSSGAQNGCSRYQVAMPASIAPSTVKISVGSACSLLSPMGLHFLVRGTVDISGMCKSLSSLLEYMPFLAGRFFIKDRSLFLELSPRCCINVFVRLVDDARKVEEIFPFKVDNNPDYLRSIFSHAHMAASVLEQSPLTVYVALAPTESRVSFSISHAVADGGLMSHIFSILNNVSQGSTYSWSRSATSIPTKASMRRNVLLRPPNEFPVHSVSYLRVQISIVGEDSQYLPVLAAHAWKQMVRFYNLSGPAPTKLFGLYDARSLVPQLKDQAGVMIASPMVAKLTAEEVATTPLPKLAEVIANNLENAIKNMTVEEYIAYQQGLDADGISAPNEWQKYVKHRTQVDCHSLQVNYLMTLREMEVMLGPNQRARLWTPMEGEAAAVALENLDAHHIDRTRTNFWVLRLFAPRYGDCPYGDLMAC